VARLTDGDWAALSPLLDEALLLEPGARGAWLDDLGKAQPALAAEIATLLAEQRLVDAQGFLSDSVVRALGTVAAGDVVGDYTLSSQLGEGGMGSVWLAGRSDGRFEGQVAIKFLSPTVLSGTGGARFRREGNLLAQLTHPHIAHLIDAGVNRFGQPYLVLEYVDGRPIDAHCDAEGLDVDARVQLFLDVCAAVADAHRKLIVHRDIKPSNVFVRRDGAVKLIDFGVAKLVGDAGSGDEPLTRDGGNVFTPEYAAPEQIRGEEVTTVTDVYALGVLLYELLAGQRPFTRAEKASIGDRTTELEPPLPSRHVSQGREFARHLEGDLDNIIMKALKFDPRERYGSVAAFADDLLRYLADEPVTAHVDTLTYRARKFVRRHRGSVATGLLTALALIIATAATTWQSIEAQRQRDAARLQLQIAQASNDFVTSLLSQAGPDGRGLTPVELIDRGMEAIRLRYAEEPQFSIKILTLLSGRYVDIGRTDKEYIALLEAEAIARKAGDRPSLLKVLCNTVETEVNAGKLPQAAARMSEARSLLASIPTVDAFSEADCLRSEAVLARQDRVVEAIEYLERAKAILERDHLVNGNAYSSLFSWLSSFNRAAGRELTAHRYHEEEMADVAEHHRQNTVAGSTAAVALAASWHTLGETRKAIRLLDTIFATSNVMNLHPFVAISYGQALGGAARYDEALTLLESGISLARSSGDDRYALRGEIERACILVRAGRLDESQAALDALWGRLAATPETVQQTAHALECQAEIHLANGQLDKADSAASDALVGLGYPQKSLGSLPGSTLTLRSRIRLAAGHLDDAIDDAKVALKMLEADVADGAQSATVGNARLALAEAELASGDAAAARRNASLAAAALENGLGADHPATREAAQLRERLVGAGHPAAAANTARGR